MTSQKHLSAVGICLSMCVFNVTAQNLDELGRSNATLLTAESRPTNSNGMRELVLLVLQNHPELSQAEAESRMAVSRVKEANAGKYPQLSFSSSYGQEQQKLYLSNRSNTFTDQAQAQLKLTQPLYDTSIGANVKRLRAGSLGYDWQLVTTREQIMLKTVELYIEVIRQHQLTELARQNLKLHRNYVSQMKDIKGPISITYSDPSTQLKDVQGRDVSSVTWMIGSDLADFDSGANYVLNATNKTKPVVMLGGGGEDQLTGSNFDDTLAGGYDSDTMTGGLGSDTFLFFKETDTTTVSNIAGSAGDVITDFGFGKNGPANADTIRLDHLFTNAVVSQLGHGSTADSNFLAAYLKFEWTHDNSNLQLVCSADMGGNSHYSKLFTLTNLQGNVGAAVYDTSQPHLTRLSGDENTSNAILQKLLEEGRMVIQ